MKLFRTDKQFESAAKSPEATDQLLKKLQHSRQVALAVVGVCVLIIVAISAWAFTSASQWIQHPSSDLPAALSQNLWCFVAPLIGVATTELLLMGSYDSQVKLLLFLRGQRSAPAAPSGSSSLS
jgi:hypothetical protein